MRDLRREEWEKRKAAEGELNWDPFDLDDPEPYIESGFPRSDPGSHVIELSSKTWISFATIKEADKACEQIFNRGRGTLRQTKAEDYTLNELLSD